MLSIKDWLVVKKWKDTFTHLYWKHPDVSWNMQHMSGEVISACFEPVFGQIRVMTIILKTQQVINNFSSKHVQDHATSGSFLFPPWVVDEKYGLDQSEAASHTMRHELSLPPFPFPFAFDQWKNSVTDEEESSKRFRDPVHVTLITCCVFDTLSTVLTL